MIVKELDLTGKSLSNYKITGKLGKGGMATVYKAHELSLNRVVALKVLSPRLSEDSEFIKRFRREAQAAAQLNHPNIVQIYAIGEEKGVHYFTMEYIKGKSLAQIKKEEGILSPGKAAGIVKQVAEALGEAHKSGLVHRDIKPSNIMIDAVGRAKVTDFGIAYVTHAQTKLTREGSIIGTPEYLSPEQCEGKTVDRRSDIYSLGVTFYELLTGKTPYEADTPVSMLMKIVKGDFPPIQEVNPNVSGPYREIVEKMMHTDPAKRYSDMDEVLEALQHLEIDMSPVRSITRVEKEPPKPLPLEYEEVETGKGSRVRRRSNKMAAVLVAAIIVILMGGAFAAKMLYFDKKSSPVKQEQPVTGEDDSPGKAVEVKKAVGMTGDENIESLESGEPDENEGIEPLSQDLDADPQTVQKNLAAAGETGDPPPGNQPSRKERLAPKPAPPPANSCVITGVGGGDNADLLTPYVEEILSQRDFMVIDGPSVANRPIAEVARSRIVVTVKHTGTTSLEYYGKSSEMYTVQVTIKIVAVKTGTTIGGPVSRTVQYTALNAEEKLKEAAAELLSRLQPALDAAKTF